MDTMLGKRKTRNVGIELLRLLSMLFIVMAHVIAWNDIAPSGGVSLSLKAIGVNNFAIITGYCSYTTGQKTLKPLKYFRLWGKVFFYSVFFIMVGKFVQPDLISEKDFLLSFLPVTSNTWWYFSSYTVVFFLQPLLIKYVNSTEIEKNIFIYLQYFCYMFL